MQPLKERMPVVNTQEHRMLAKQDTIRPVDYSSAVNMKV